MHNKIWQHLKEGKYQEALAFCQSSREPENADILHLTGLSLLHLGRFREAIDHLKRSVDQDPQNSQFIYNLGKAYEDFGNKAEAIAWYAKSFNLTPDYLNPANNLANLLLDGGKLEAALKVGKTALIHHPENHLLHSTVGRVFVAMGHLEEGLEHYRQALVLDPQCWKTRSNMLFNMNYLDESRSSEIFKAHTEWDAMHGNPEFRKDPICRMPEHRIRVGYVSGDFRRHSVAYFIEPVLFFHNRDRFEIFSYADVRFPDEITERIRSISEHWRDIRALDDAAIEKTIRNDEIDILVDLAGHTGYRLNVFVAHPAKVNVTYLGYPNTTGLAAMDYRLTDIIADPPGEDDYYTEKLFRLDRCFLCFAPPAEAPEIVPPPYRRNGYITFGSFNSHPKTNLRTMEIWAQILKRVPSSRLCLKCKSLGDPLNRQFIHDHFLQFGVEKERIVFLEFHETLSGHLASYGEIDVALDPFPYNGTTTTCEAIWMGVPVLTLSGSRHRSRVGTSILTTLELESFAVNSVGSYIATAVNLAGSPAILDELRPALRQAMANSPLCNGKTFVSDLEQAYMGMLQS